MFSTPLYLMRVTKTVIMNCTMNSGRRSKCADSCYSPYDNGEASNQDVDRSRDLAKFLILLLALSCSALCNAGGIYRFFRGVLEGGDVIK